MPHNEQIEKQVSDAVKNWKHTNSKKMFGGMCHLIKGNMFCGVLKNDLILRLGKESAETVLNQPHTKPFDITGKPMKGWVMVAQDGFETQEKLTAWLEMARSFALTLPPK